MLRLVVISLLLVSCGSSGGSGSSPAAASIDTSPKAYTTLAEAPTCTAANDKQLAYIEDTDRLVYCKSGTWTDIERGESLIEGTRCVSKVYSQAELATLGLDTASAWGTIFSYSLLHYSNDVVMVIGEIIDGSRTYSISVLRSPSQVDYSALQSLAINYDMKGTGNLGFWVLETSGDVRKATYTDISDLGQDNKVEIEFAADECETYEY